MGARQRIETVVCSLRDQANILTACILSRILAAGGNEYSELFSDQLQTPVSSCQIDHRILLPTYTHPPRPSTTPVSNRNSTSSDEQAYELGIYHCKVDARTPNMRTQLANETSKPPGVDPFCMLLLP